MNCSTGVTDSAKKWTYIPGKSIRIAPLNLNDIKKELLERMDEDDTDSAAPNENTVKKGDTNSQFSPVKLEAITEFSMCESSSTAKCKHENLNEESKHVENNEFKKSEEQEDLKSDLHVSDKENIYVQESTSYSKDKNKNDSFDLGLSVLSLNTPVKQKKPELSCITPRINIIPTDSVKKTNSVHQFITPKVNNKQHQSLAKSALFSVTPMNKQPVPQRSTPGYPFMKTPTPYSQTPICKATPIRCSVPRQMELFESLQVNGVNYLVVNMLGRGGSSEVFHCYCPEKRIHVAIKCVSLSNRETSTVYKNEVQLLQSLDKCDRIIKMYDYEILENEGKMNMVLEKGGEDLCAILKKLALKQTHIPVYMLLFYWLEMLYAVKQIHENGVIHSDLKPANFLRADGGLKLIDFGIASSVQEDMTSVFKTTTEGSRNYISPEALKDYATNSENSAPGGNAKFKLHYESDVWSLGCILYQLIYNRTPFQHLTHLWTQLAAIMDPNHKIEFPPADWLPHRILNTVKRCLQYNVKSRPSVGDLIAEYEEMLRHL